MEYHEGLIKNTEFFTTAELAKKLKMNVQVITRKVQSGEIAAYKIGKDWRIPEPAVYEWLESKSNRNGATRGAKPGDDATRRNRAAKAATPPPKRKYLLEYILAQFEPNRSYSKDEATRLIARHYKEDADMLKEFVAEKMLTQEGDNFQRSAAYKLSG